MTNAEHTAQTEAEHQDAHHEPHMPAPSLSPIILAAGMTALGFGLVLGPVLLVLGAIGTLIGLGTWLYDEIRNDPTAEA